LLFDSTKGFTRCMDGFHVERKGLFGGDDYVGVQPYWHSGSFAKDKCCSGRPLPVCHVVWYNRPWAMGLWGVGYTAHQDHRSSIRDILAMRNMVALRLIFEYSKDLGSHILSNAYEAPRTHYIPDLIRIYISLFEKKNLMAAKFKISKKIFKNLIIFILFINLNFEIKIFIMFAKNGLNYELICEFTFYPLYFVVLSLKAWDFYNLNYQNLRLDQG
jgi:hypothetical protein